MITGINHITLAVQDIDRSFAFYRDVLGLKPLVKWHLGAYFVVGDIADGFWFCLNVDPNRQPTDCYTHYAFSVSEADFNQMCQKILASGAHVFKDNTSPGASLYFLDPDGHKLEIHVSNWQQRTQTKKAHAGKWENVEWFI